MLQGGDGHEGEIGRSRGLRATSRRVGDEGDPPYRPLRTPSRGVGLRRRANTAGIERGHVVLRPSRADFDIDRYESPPAIRSTQAAIDGTGAKRLWNCAGRIITIFQPFATVNRVRSSSSVTRSGVFSIGNSIANSSR